MKKYIYPLAVTAAMLTAASCDDNEIIETPIPDSQKEMISFSLSDGASQTRAGLHTTATTRVVMRIMSEDNASPSNKKYVRTVATASVQQTGTDNSTFSTISFEDLYKCYWDDAHGRNSHLSVYAVAVPGKNDDSKVEESSLTAGNGSSSANWGDKSNNTINWKVTSGETPQTVTTKDEEDLVYSRNIRENGTDGRYIWDYNKTPQGYPENTGQTTHSNGRLQFTQAASTDAGHFDKGHLVFTHALSRINLTLVSGTGFNDADDNETSHDFELSSDGIIFKDMYVKADLDLTNGTWVTKTTGNVVAKPTISSTTYESNIKAAYNCMIQVIPDYEFGMASTTNVISFTIDDNTYYVDQKMIYDALKDATGVTITNEKIKMEQQKCYNITIKINKTAIDNVTATLEDWTYVNAADKNLYNSYINLSIYSATGGGCDNIDLYRLADGDGNIYTDQTSPTADSKKFYNWKGNYTDKATINKRDGATTGDGKYTTNWFFEDNKTFYHFRTVKQGTVIDTESSKDKFTINSGPQDEAHDYHWGAPMKSGATFKYNVSGTDQTEGYGDNIYKAIGSTKDEIKITELHMMSNINIVLETTATSEGNHVNLSGAKVYLTKFVTQGTVDMGTGLVTPDNNPTSTSDVIITSPSGSEYWETTNVKTKPFTYSVVPQSLTRGPSDEDFIGVTIVTGDNNQYYIVKDLSKIFASSTTQGGNNVNDPNQPIASESSDEATKQNAYITRWYPNHSYTYTFKITKKGIESITATLQEWTIVNAANKDIDLES